jgi:hypothetical protein
MIRLVLCSLLLLATLQSKSQEILYVFPDSVEKAINSYITKRPSDDKNTQYYVTLYKDQDVYTAYISPYPKSFNQNTSKWIEASNRRVLINNARLPILFEVDYTFGTPDEVSTGFYGSRDGKIKRVAVIQEGYSIKFNKKGAILSR